MSESKRKRKFTGVFWDIQNVNIPKGMSPQAICQKIRDLKFTKGLTMMFLLNLQKYTLMYYCS